MALTRWNPFRGLVSVQRDLDSMMEDFFGHTHMFDWDGGIWSPPVDITETDDNLVVSIEIPGMTKEDVKITLQDNVLTIRGEKKQETEKRDANYHRVERSYGSFTRSFSLPAAVEGEKIKAQYKDGLLKITLPKAEQVKPKEIPIAIEEK